MSNQSEKRWAIRLYELILSTFLASPIFAMTLISPNKAIADSNNHLEKITICHRTNNANKPYVQVSISKNAYDAEHNKKTSKSDHLGEHQGTTVYSSKETQRMKDLKTKWGDYIVDSENTEQSCNLEKTKIVEDNKDTEDTDCKDYHEAVIENDNNPTEIISEDIKKEVLSSTTKPPVIAETETTDSDVLAETGTSLLVNIFYGVSTILICAVLYKSSNPENLAIEEITI